MITAAILAVSLLSALDVEATNTTELMVATNTGVIVQTAQEETKPEEKTPPTEQQQQTPNAEALAAQEKLNGLIKMMDADAVCTANSWQFNLAQRQVFVITDPNANRMRIMSPIISATDLSAPLLERMLQANYDAALDARYAIAQEIVWSVFIHPLTSLTEKDFLSGAAQTVIAGQTFGTTFSSGMFVYGGGDTGGIHERLLEELEKRTQPTM